MNYLRRPFAWGICAVALLIVVSALRLPSVAEEAEAPAAEPAAPDAVVTDQAPAAKPEPIVVPDGTPAELLAFIDKVAHPDREFQTTENLMAYLREASTAISTAADKVLAMNSTDEQKVAAVHWMLESFRIRQHLGDADAEAQSDKFLDSMEGGSSPQLAKALRELRLMRKLRQWRTLDEAERGQVVDEFVADIKAGDVTTDQVFLLYRFVDMLADTPDSALATKMIDQLSPQLAKSDDPQVQKMTAEIEGIGRRISLPGNKIEIEGKFLDGKPIDWNSYRGKVVLLDFWATDCGYCIAEVPNLMENYRLFHDKGFDIVGISMDSKRAPVEQYMAESGVPWPTLFQENPHAQGWDHPVASKYAINAIPRLILVDQQGKVVSMNARGRNLTAELRRLLGAPAVDQGAGAAAESGDEQSGPSLTVAPPAP